VIGAIALSAAFVAAQPLAGAKITIDAVVLKVDRLHRRATIRYAALDTAPAGVRTVAVPEPKAIKRLWIGESIRAVADTSRTPWVLSSVAEIRG
jgi:hypothetical protein